MNKLIPDLEELNKLPRHKICNECQKEITVKPEGACRVIYPLCDECAEELSWYCDCGKRMDEYSKEHVGVCQDCR